jgi:hypothetical protein
MSILPGFGCPDKVGDVFSPMDRKGICEAGLGEVSHDMLHSLESLPKDATEHHAVCLSSIGL